MRTVIIRSWAVYFTVPEKYSDDPSVPIRNMNHEEGIIADTCEDAIACVRSAFPTCTITSVHHRGVVHRVARTVRRTPLPIE